MLNMNKNLSLLILVAFFFTFVLGGSGWGQIPSGGFPSSTKGLGRLSLTATPESINEKSLKDISDKSSSLGIDSVSLEASLKQEAENGFRSRMGYSIIFGGVGLAYLNNESQSFKNTGALWLLCSLYQLFKPSEGEKKYDAYKKDEGQYAKYLNREKEGVSFEILGLGLLASIKFLEYQNAVDPTYSIDQWLFYDGILSFVVGIGAGSEVRDFIQNYLDELSTGENKG